MERLLTGSFVEGRPPIRMIEIEGEYFVPPGTPPETYRYVVPDNVVEAALRKFIQNVDEKVGLDLFGGTGTFSRVAARLGGLCHYCECDPEQYAIAKRQIPNPKLGNLMFLGDSLRTAPAPHGGADYVYTSFPFDWLEHDWAGYGPGMHGTGFILHEVLGRGGLVVIDSAAEAKRKRDGATVTTNPAERTIDYLDLFGFRLLDRLDFSITNAPEGCDDQFSELLFGRKWEHGPHRDHYMAILQ